MNTRIDKSHVKQISDAIQDTLLFKKHTFKTHHSLQMKHPASVFIYFVDSNHTLQQVRPLT